jgi:hypothetical protein
LREYSCLIVHFLRYGVCQCLQAQECFSGFLLVSVDGVFLQCLIPPVHVLAVVLNGFLQETLVVFWIRNDTVDKLVTVDEV